MKRAIIVAGLGRCGSSLTMQMLERGGVPVLGRWPIFDALEAITRANRDAWLRENAPGRAAKIIAPLNRVPRDLPAIVIWLDRDREQQAGSILKWCSSRASAVVPQSQIRVVAMLEHSRAQALSDLDAPDRPRLMLTFEQLVEDTLRAAASIANFIAINDGPSMCVRTAVTAVRPRAATCYSGLLEEELVIGGGATS